MRTAARIVAGIAAAALIAIALVIPGASVLLSPAVPPKPDPSLVAVAIDHPTAAATVDVSVTNYDLGTSPSTIRLYVRASFEAEIGERILALGDAHGPKADETSIIGFSIVLAGPLAVAVRECNDSRFRLYDVTFDQLHNLEKRAVVEYIQASEADARPEVGDGNPESALEYAAGLDYAVLQPSELYANEEAWEVNFGDGSREFRGYFNYVTCVLDGSSVESRGESSISVSLPAVAAASQSGDGRPTGLRLGSSARLGDDFGNRIQSANADYSRNETGIVVFSDTSSSATEERPVLRLSGTALRVEDADGRAAADAKIFVAGVGASLLGTLLVAGTRDVVRWSTRRRRGRGPSPVAR